MAVRVLVVEDDGATRFLLGAFLERAEGLVNCGEACDGWEGLEQVEALRPDLVLLDLIMPGLDGLGFLKALSGRPPEARPRVIILSGVGADAYIQRALALGADYYLVKPVDMGELAGRIFELFPTRPERVGQGGAAWLLLRLGAGPGSLGYEYACFALELLAEEKSPMQMKALYLRTAERFHTSYSCVERNLRTLIRNMHQAADPQYAALGFAGREKPPENGVFLRRAAEVLKKQGYSL